MWEHGPPSRGFGCSREVFSPANPLSALARLACQHPGVRSSGETGQETLSLAPCLSGQVSLWGRQKFSFAGPAEGPGQSAAVERRGLGLLLGRCRCGLSPGTSAALVPVPRPLLNHSLTPSGQVLWGDTGAGAPTKWPTLSLASRHHLPAAPFPPEGPETETWGRR